MLLADGKATAVRRAILGLYRSPLSEGTLLEAGEEICRITDAQYMSFCLLAPRKRSYSLFVSNNPPEFIPVYLSVFERDFLLENLVARGGEYVLSRDPNAWEDPAHHEFIGAVQEARPISDVAYVPLAAAGGIGGYCGLGRAGAASPPITDAQLELFRFMVSFVGDAFTRALIPPQPEENAALLDRWGRVACAGARIGEAFRELFGPGRQDAGFQLRAFRRRYREFLEGPLRPGSAWLSLAARGRRYVFLFELMRPGGLTIRDPTTPCAAVLLLTEIEEERCSIPIDRRALASRYGLTPRELAVVDGIYRGKMNKEIASELGIEEATVKRHSHNIYEKTGLRSRVELVLGLFGED